MNIVVITGANGGLGKALSMQFALQNYQIFMLVRNLEKGKIAQQEVKALSKNPNIELLQLDLSSFASLKSFAKNIETKLANQKISILINNAGVLSRDKTINKEQTMWKVNFLGTSLLTLLLLPFLKKDGKIYNIVSLTYRFGKIPVRFLDKLCSSPIKRNFFLFAYADSKLANFLFVRSLAKEFRAQNKLLSIYAIDPGVINSNMITMNLWFDVLADKIFRPWIQTTKVAAQKVFFIVNNVNPPKENGKLLKRSLCPKKQQNKILNLSQKSERIITKNAVEENMLSCLQNLLEQKIIEK